MQTKTGKNETLGSKYSHQRKQIDTWHLKWRKEIIVKLIENMTGRERKILTVEFSRN